MSMRCVQGKEVVPSGGEMPPQSVASPTPLPSSIRSQVEGLLVLAGHLLGDVVAPPAKSMAAEDR